MFKKYKRGFVLGKFMPPHKGHEFLCNFAQKQCDYLTILVGSLPSEPIPGELRYKWMKEMFPECNVIWTNEVLPQYPEEHADFWNIWTKVAKNCQTDKIEAVFASESYGERLAKELDADFIPCDIKRETFNCSGTIVRDSIYSKWEFLPDVVKNHYRKRICLFGPESTGKTTLAKQLAVAYNTIFLPEYGRSYTEFYGSSINEEDLKKIVRGQIASVESAKQSSNKVIIEDTDVVMSGIWSDMLFGKRNPWFDKYNDYADLYLLCDIDIPWVDDGTRYFKNEDDRRRFYNICEEELVNRKVRYVKISGNETQRYLKSTIAINELLYIK
jgi:NadR type nicotinamide-nucleotide adenylyltransferase